MPPAIISQLIEFNNLLSIYQLVTKEARMHQTSARARFLAPVSGARQKYCRSRLQMRGFGSGEFGEGVSSQVFAAVVEDAHVVFDANAAVGPQRIDDWPS